MDMDKYIGRLLDNRYEILEVIGIGGMAVVYKARCHRLNRLVAIKILKSEYSQDEEFRRRFHAESQAVAMLSHPNIVSVYDVSTNADADYIVMELVDGISLKQYMEMKGVLNWKETLHFAIQIAKALEHAHSRGIVHRDIKPHNIMVLKNGSVKVTDFGIARIMSKSNTLTKEALGSVHYISPEQAKGGRVDNRSDLYSLGVVMYEMMTGRPPFDGESPVSVAIQHINGGAKMPSTLNPNIPGGLEQIIMKAMAHEPNDRYDSATAMLKDLDEFRQNPSMLFDYHTPPTDAVTRLQRTMVMPPVSEFNPVPRTTGSVGGQSLHPAGERIHTGSTGRISPNSGRVPSGSGRVSSNSGRMAPPAGRQPQRTASARRQTEARRTAAARKKRQETEEKSSQVAIIAIVVCSIVAIIAIGVFLFSLFGEDSVTKPEKTAVVPSVLNRDYEELGVSYGGFQIQLAEYQYSDRYEKGKIMSQEPEAGAKVSQNTIYVIVSRGPEDVKEDPVMENMENLEASYAESFLKGMNLVPIRREASSETVAKGYVISTDPPQGSKVKEGQTVTIWVSTGSERPIPMPNLKNREASAAEEILVGLKLAPEIQEVHDDNVEKGRVIRTEPAADEKLKEGEKVIVYVSSGPEVVREYMPNVVGLSVTTAQSILDAKGFDKVNIEVVESDEPKDTVIQQSEKAEMNIDINQEIILTVSKGPKETVPPTTVPPSTVPPSTVPPATTVPAPGSTEAAAGKTVTIQLKESVIPKQTVKITLICGSETLEKEIAAGTSSVQFTVKNPGSAQYQVKIGDIAATEGEHYTIS